MTTKPTTPAPIYTLSYLPVTRENGRLTIHSNSPEKVETIHRTNDADAIRSAKTTMKAVRYVDEYGTLRKDGVVLGTLRRNSAGVVSFLKAK